MADRFYNKTKFFFIILAVLSVYSYGWKVTEIEVGELLHDFHLVKPLIKELASPDLFTREKKLQIVETAFFLSQKNTAPVDKEGVNPMLILSRQSGEIADKLTVRGLNLKPKESGVLYWVNAIEQEFPLGIFVTDTSGAFQKDITVPPSARGLRQTVKAVLSWEEGDWQVSETLSLTFEKMVETVFLALMATTFGVLVAVPLSFLGASNLMTGTKLGTLIY